MLLALALPALAESAWDTEHQLDVTWYAKGLRYLFTAEDRIPVWRKEGDLLFGDTYVAPGVIVDLSPAYARAGGRVHFVPVAVLDIVADAQVTGYFGAFSALIDFDDPTDDHSEATIESGVYDDRRQSGWGLKLGLTPTPQIQVSKFILALPQEFAHFSLLRPQDARGAYWYEPFYDLMLEWDDTIMVNSAVAFWAFRESSKDDPRMFWLGAQFNHQYVFGTEDRQVKLGPMAVFKPSQSKWVPTVATFAQAYLVADNHEVLPPLLVAALIW
jgi:hypothetical protein